MIMEYRIIYTLTDGAKWATVNPTDSEEIAIKHALLLRDGMVPKAHESSKEIVHVAIEERKVVEGIPMGWKAFGTH
jgi:hypothetical protein